MRRSALLGTLLLLGGCSGLGHFLGDTARIPGQNPNGSTGVSENVQRARGSDPAADAIVPQDGNVWPGPPQPLPTLSDVSRNGGQTDGGLLGGATAMPRGGSMSMGEQNAVHRGAPLDESGLSSGFSGGGGLSESVTDPSVKFRSQHPAAAPTGSGNSNGNGGNIVIPNGDGTSTVISPDGSVKTIKGTPK
jgi:hypothetical protein